MDLTKQASIFGMRLSMAASVNVKHSNSRAKLSLNFSLNSILKVIDIFFCSVLAWSLNLKHFLVWNEYFKDPTHSLHPLFPLWLMFLWTVYSSWIPRNITRFFTVRRLYIQRTVDLNQSWIRKHNILKPEANKNTILLTIGFLTRQCGKEQRSWDFSFT